MEATSLRDRWLIVLLLTMAAASITPHLSYTLGKVIAVVGISTIGVISILKPEYINGLKFPVCVFLLLIVSIVFQALITMTGAGEVTFINSIRPAVYILVSSITILIIPSAIDSKEAIIGVLISVTLVSLIGIFAVVINSQMLVPFVEEAMANEYILFGENTLRPVPISIFENPNRLSAFAIAGIIGGCGIWYIDRNVYALLAAVISAVTIVLTGSRTPFFAVFVAGMTAAFLRFDDKTPAILWTAVFATAIPVVAITTVITPSIVGAISQPRAQLWAGSVRAIAESPIFGYGFGTSTTAIYEFVSGSWAGTQPHNGYLKIAVEGGLIVASLYGILAFASIIYRIRIGVSKITSVWLVLSFSYLSVQIFESKTIFSMAPTPLIIGLSIGYLIHE